MANPMRTVSFKLPETLDDALTEIARRRNVSRSVLAREALLTLTTETDRSVTAMVDELIGSLEGPPDLSSSREYMAGYGE